MHARMPQNAGMLECRNAGMPQNAWNAWNAWNACGMPGMPECQLQ